MSTENVINNQRIAKNTFLLYLRTIFVLAVSLYTSRLVLKVLGVDDYQIYIPTPENIYGDYVWYFVQCIVCRYQSVYNF